MSASILDELDQLLKGETPNSTTVTSKKLDPAGVKAWLTEEVKTAKGETPEIAKARAKHAKTQLSAALKAFKGGATEFEVSLFDASKHRAAQSFVTDLEALSAKLDKLDADDTSAPAENTDATTKPKPDGEQAGDAAKPTPDEPAAAPATGDDVEKGWSVASDDQPWTTDMRHMKIDSRGRILHRKSVAFG